MFKPVGLRMFFRRTAIQLVLDEERARYILDAWKNNNLPSPIISGIAAGGESYCVKTDELIAIISFDPQKEAQMALEAQARQGQARPGYVPPNASGRN